MPISQWSNCSIGKGKWAINFKSWFVDYFNQMTDYGLVLHICPLPRSSVFYAPLIEFRFQNFNGR